MKKVIVIGCPGGGKSCFSKALHEATGLPLYHLDMMYWNADKTTVDRETFLSRLRSVVSKDAWIIDGNYSSTLELRVGACDTIFFLDYDVNVCLDGVKARVGKPRSDMPWVEDSEDTEFIEYIKAFAAEQRPSILNLLGKYPDKDLIVLKTRADADEYLDAIKLN